MSTLRPEKAHERWQQFLSLIEFSQFAMRRGLRERNPQAGTEELERMFQAWWSKEGEDPRALRLRRGKSVKGDS